MRKKVMEIWPEIDWIQDAELREAVLLTWVTAFENSPLEPAEHKAFESDLKKRIHGEVHFDPLTRGLYSTDASIYQIEPVAVVVPRDEADVCAAIETAVGHAVSKIGRASCRERV